MLERVIIIASRVISVRPSIDYLYIKVFIALQTATSVMIFAARRGMNCGTVPGRADHPENERCGRLTGEAAERLMSLRQQTPT